MKIMKISVQKNGRTQINMINADQKQKNHENHENQRPN